MRALLLLAALVLATAAHAQRPDPLQPEGDNMTTPPTWVVRFDAAHGHGQHEADHPPTVGADSTADVFFVNMTPGWHVTTGPAAVFYHPASTASGAFRAESMIHLFDPEGRTEAFGLFFGGQDLGGEAIAYDYFVIRNSGEFLVKRRTGAETEVLVPWTASDAIVTFEDDTACCVANTLAVEVREAERVYGEDGTHIDAPALVVFSVNGVPVARMPADEVRTDGVVGLRINHALNLHVETFAVTEQ